MKPLLPIFRPLFLASVFASSAAAEEKPAGLDGATGNVFKVDPKAKTFELLKETEYDPKTDIGKSRFTIHWEDGVEITRIKDVKSFEGISGPVVAKFYGIDGVNRKSLAGGRGFEARVVEIHSNAGMDSIKGIGNNGNSVSGIFKPSGGAGARAGEIEIEGE